MLAVCAGSEARLDAVVENLLQELADNRDEKIKLISRCGLDNFLATDEPLLWLYVR